MFGRDGLSWFWIGFTAGKVYLGGTTTKKSKKLPLIPHTWQTSDGF
jgi:hypothetical protein